MEFLFSYGTLQLEQIQLNVFGRKLRGERDAIVGYKRSRLPIKDESVIASLGMDHYPILVSTKDPNDLIEGVVFTVTATELQQADEYEGDDYKRVRVTLWSGKVAWVYVGLQEPPN